jgi:hypothetical protein
MGTSDPAAACVTVEGNKREQRAGNERESTRQQKATRESREPAMRERAGNERESTLSGIK